MKVNKSSVFSFFLIIILPLLGVIYSLLKLKKGNAKLIIFSLSTFVFFFVLTIPPFQDLYRRYYESYFIYNYNTTFSEAMAGHLDFLFYALGLIFKKIGIPFFYISSIFTSVAFYMTMMALYDLHLNNEEDKFSANAYRLSFIILFCFINIIIIALGLRFGLAVAFSLRACTLNLERRSYLKSYILFFMACITHFSMLFVLMTFLLSKFVRVKNYLVIPFSLLCAIFGGAILPFILSKFNILGISEYVTKGYVDGSLADSSSNTNAIIIACYNYLIIFILAFFHLRLPTNNQKFNNFINVFFISTFIIIISYTAFNRYFVGVGTFMLLIRVLSDKPLNGFFIRNFFLLIALFNFAFSDIYVQRRPLTLAHMWDGLYTPSILRLSYDMNDFNAYLKYINTDGDWIGHEIRQ